MGWERKKSKRKIVALFLLLLLLPLLFLLNSDTYLLVFLMEDFVMGKLHFRPLLLL